MSYIGNSPGNASQRVVTQKVATAGQTRFASDSGYATGYVDVIVNGSDLVAGVDFNETGDGINIDLVEACAADDNVKIVAYIPRGLSDGYTKPEANALLALKADLVAGKIPSSQLPAYVDDVLEYANLAAFPATGSTGIIYVAQDTNNCYRWSGSAYIVLTDLSSYYTKTQSDAKYPIQDSSTGALQLPSGTTAQRPTGNAGKIRHNTTTGYVEYWDTSTSQWIGIGAFQASGGNTVVDSGGYRYHTFTTSGTFVVSAGAKTVDYLLVAGGGSGGGHYNGNYEGGGGGAGGLIASTFTVSSGIYAVVIGGGGSPAAGVGNTSGSNSSVFNQIAIGGGFGGAGTQTGANGGSGGGSGWISNSARDSQTGGGAGTSGQGNSGGAAGGVYNGGGGGGGKTASGEHGVNGGRGGAGYQWLNGSYYAGGGGGSRHGSGTTEGGGTGGIGGGGDGQSFAAGAGTGVNGTTNTGGGGGGGWNSGASAGANGGSGIVIIRYPI